MYVRVRVVVLCNQWTWREQVALFIRYSLGEKTKRECCVVWTPYGQSFSNRQHTHSHCSTMHYHEPFLFMSSRPYHQAQIWRPSPVVVPIQQNYLGWNCFDSGTVSPLGNPEAHPVGYKGVSRFCEASWTIPSGVANH